MASCHPTSREACPAVDACRRLRREILEEANLRTAEAAPREWCRRPSSPVAPDPVPDRAERDRRTDRRSCRRPSPTVAATQSTRRVPRTAARSGISPILQGPTCLITVPSIGSRRIKWRRARSRSRTRRTIYLFNAHQTSIRRSRSTVAVSPSSARTAQNPRPTSGTSPPPPARPAPFRSRPRKARG